MKSKIRRIINLFFFILIINTKFLQAHDSFNGGCKNHCKESDNAKNVEKINDKNQIEDKLSCLNKSLCRG